MILKYEGRRTACRRRGRIERRIRTTVAVTVTRVGSERRAVNGEVNRRGRIAIDPRIAIDLGTDRGIGIADAHRWTETARGTEGGTEIVIVTVIATVWTGTAEVEECVHHPFEGLQAEEAEVRRGEVQCVIVADRRVQVTADVAAVHQTDADDLRSDAIAVDRPNDATVDDAPPTIAIVHTDTTDRCHVIARVNAIVRAIVAIVTEIVAQSPRIVRARRPRESRTQNVPPHHKSESSRILRQGQTLLSLLHLRPLILLQLLPQQQPLMSTLLLLL